MKLFFVIIILGLLCLQLVQYIPESKYVFLIKPAILCAILLSLFAFAGDIDFKNTIYFDKYSAEKEQVWINTKQNSEKIIKDQMLDLCTENGLSIYNITVDLKTDYQSFELERIYIEGPDKSAAKSLICSTYKIDKSLVK